MQITSITSLYTQYNIWITAGSNFIHTTVWFMKLRFFFYICKKKIKPFSYFKKQMLFFLKYILAVENFLLFSLRRLHSRPLSHYYISNQTLWRGHLFHNFFFCSLTICYWKLEIFPPHPLYQLLLYENNSRLCDITLCFYIWT